MFFRSVLSLLFSSLLCVPSALADEPISGVLNVKPTGGGRGIVGAVAFPHQKIESLEEAAKTFDAKSLANLKKQVDFDKRFVLVFAWSGSGQDHLDYVVMESFPEQVRFRFRAGETKDLRDHYRVYSLRKNVRYGFADRPDPKTNEGADLKEVIVTPSKPHLLSDKRTRLSIKKDTWWKNRQRGGYPQLQNDDMTLAIVPNTVIASGGRVYYLDPPKEYKFGEVRESDVIHTIVDSCKFSILSEKAKAPTIKLKKMNGYVSFYCDNRNAVDGGMVKGKGYHFVALRVERAEIYRRASSNVLGPGMDLDVVTNFGVKRIRLEYMQEQKVTIGPETITLKSINYDHPTRSVAVKVDTEPKADKAAAVIVKYGRNALH